ncbi:hypothetical protein BZ25_02265 [Petrotoga sp. Shatin.DS.tank11.9.2.9.3]|nr:hypothetical protein BZ25_02265 [Petrotoga sp. Shatin.DS.tank11.9.2.9.3]
MGSPHQGLRDRRSLSKKGGKRGIREKSLFLMGGLRGEGAQITTKRSLQKNVLKGSQGGALHPPSG